MKYLLSLIVLTLFMTASAKENYPVVYAKQGTPLFKAVDSFKSLQKYSLMKTAVSDYIDKAEKTRIKGIDTDKSSDKKDIKTYLKSLRTLQNKHDKIIGFSTKILLDSIKQNDYQQFSDIVDFGINYYKERAKLKQQIISFYKKNRNKGKITSLDKIIKYDRTAIKRYASSNRTYAKQNKHTYSNESKKITLIFMNGCSYCVKAKALLDSSGKSYRELNVKSTYGARLFKKYNGRGLPLIIVDNKVIRGYNRDRILKEIQ